MPANAEALEAQAEAAEQARLAAEAEAEEQARLAAEAEAAEQARLAAEAEAAEEARLAAEAEAAEQARLAAEAKAAEEARLAAEAEAEEQARLAAEAEAAEQARLAAEAEAEAEAEVEQVALLTQRQQVYDETRAQELAVLTGLSLRIRFLPGGASLSQKIEQPLDRIFGPLYLYSEMPVTISVATNEFEAVTDNDLLSLERGRAIMAYLVNRGLEQSRFEIRIESGQGLPSDTHRVRVSVEDLRQ